MSCIFHMPPFLCSLFTMFYVSHFVNVLLSIFPWPIETRRKKNEVSEYENYVVHYAAPFPRIMDTFLVSLFSAKCSSFSKWQMVNGWIYDRSYCLWRMASIFIQMHHDHLEMAWEIEKSIEWIQRYEFRVRIIVHCPFGFVVCAFVLLISIYLLFSLWFVMEYIVIFHFPRSSNHWVNAKANPMVNA